MTNVENTFYIIGTVAGPHPYPMMVRDFQRVIGDECLVQMPEMTGRQPDAVIACVGGGSNAMGIFYPYIEHEGVRLIGVEAAGLGLDTGKHAASLSAGSPGVLHGNRTYLLQDENGQITETHSISAGLDYPGVGPEHAYLKDIGRAEYVGITDDEALAAFHRLCRTEGIIPALESSHAVAYAMKLAPTMRPDQHLLVNLSGRGDKDIGTVADLSARVLCRPRAGQTSRARMSRIAGTLDALLARGRKALIPYVTGRRPVRRRHAGHHAGAGRRRRRHHRTRRAVLRPDGRRPGDPEGLASVRWRAASACRRCWTSCATFRRQDSKTPVVLMGYANPIERYDQRHGAGAFVADAAEAGVDGVLVVDYPPEECEAFAAGLQRQGLDLIFLLAPTSTEQRMQRGRPHRQRLRLLRVAEGRDRRRPPRHRRAWPRRCRASARTCSVPVGVGFGIRDAATARAVAQVADAVVIGSRWCRSWKPSRATMSPAPARPSSPASAPRWTP